MNHEEPIARAFLIAAKRDRFLAVLSTRGGRDKLRKKEFAHFDGLDPRFAHQIPPGAQNEDDIESTLKAKGAPSSCYVWSENDEIDGQELPLAEALAEVVGMSMGTFLSCIPGKLAYFEGEEPGERYICER
ncbi:MAG: hypothetical protein ACYSU0_10800 [Planctomycetota bacterium]|jgi:hypothetical protein